MQSKPQTCQQIHLFEIHSFKKKWWALQFKYVNVSKLWSWVTSRSLCIFSDYIQHTVTAHLQHECLVMELVLYNLSESCTENIQLIDSNNASQQLQTCSIEGGQVYGQCCSPAELVPLTHSRVQAVKKTIGPAAQHMGNSIPPGRHKAKHRSSRKPKTKLYSHLDLSQWQCQQLNHLVLSKCPIQHTRWE